MKLVPQCPADFLGRVFQEFLVVAPLKLRLERNTPAIDEKVRDQRRRLLEYGAAVQLELDRQVQFQPLDDRELLEQAKPVARDGNVLPDPRHDGQVKSVPCSFIILGGNHDLSESMRRLGGGTVEYVRVTTRLYRGVAGER